MRAAVFFDRDNTLIAADDYLGDASQVVLVDGAADAVARVRGLGLMVIVFSNQSGVARGMYSEDDVAAVNARMDALLAAANPQAIIDRHEYCPDHPEAVIERYRRESDRRKPAPGMIYSAADALDLDLSHSFVIGDAPRDIEAGKKAGCFTILFTDALLPRSPAANAEMKSPPDRSIASLNEAIDIVEQIVRPNVQSQTPAAIHPIASNAPDSTVSTPASDTSKLEALAEKILFELKHHNEHPTDFSVTKLIAGIAQVVSIAMVFLAYLNRNDASFGAMLIFAVWIQCFAIAMLIMGKPSL